MANRHMKICSISLIIRETQIKTTMRYNLTSVRMTSSINQWTTSIGGGCGEKGILLDCRGECRLVQPLWESLWKFLKKLKMELIALWPSNSAFGNVSKEPRSTNLKRYMHSYFHSSIIYNHQDMEATQVPNNRQVDKEVVHTYKRI